LGDASKAPRALGIEAHGKAQRGGGLGLGRGGRQLP